MRYIAAINPDTGLPYRIVNPISRKAFEFPVDLDRVTPAERNALRRLIMFGDIVPEPVPEPEPEPPVAADDV